MDDELEGHLTRAQQEDAAARVFARQMAVSAVEDLVRAIHPDYDQIYDGRYVERVVDALVEAARA